MAKPKNTVTEYRNYYLPLHFPVLLLSGDYWRISDVPSARLHFHNCLEIGVCHSDSGVMRFYQEELTFQAGDVTVIPRNVPHTTFSHPGCASHWSYLMIDPRELFRGLLPATWANYELSSFLNSSYQYILNREKYPTVYQLVTGIIRELEEQRPNYQLSARGLLLSLYIELRRIESMENNVTPLHVSPSCGAYLYSREPSPAPDSSDLTDSAPARENSLIIAPALDYIEDNYMQQFTIEHLADLCHWSPTHFRRVFHEIMGTSPLDFVNNTRIAKACNLLRTTEHSILDISEMVGFHSVSSFNRYFTKVMQMSPREYRKQILSSDKASQNQSILEYAGWMYPE